ncbi:MAG: PKD domain-containing protein, partial [Planctomycetota bacterium]
FSYAPPIGCAPLEVCFIDQTTSSEPPVSWLWDFGDGGTSPEQNPCHIYTVPGTYTVSLTVTLGCGMQDTEVKPGCITVLPPAPAADFIATPTSGCCPLTVSFTDLSTGNPTSWHWDFGDGGTSTAQNPTHVYDCVGCNGCYTVTLTVSNDCGLDAETKVNYICVEHPPTAAFTFEPGPAPCTVCFTSLSTCAAVYEWNFGDGGPPSNEQNPCHTYAGDGVYNVTLTVVNACGVDTAEADVPVGDCGCNKTLSTPEVAPAALVPVMVDDPSGIMGFDITLTYCADLMSVVGVNAGDCLDGSWSLDWAVPAPGELRVIGFSFSPLVSVDPCSLFDVIFDCIEPAAVCPLGFGPIALSDSAGTPIPGVCTEPGTVSCGIDHLHYYFLDQCFPLGAGACPMDVLVRIEAHDEIHGLMAVNVPVELSTTCGLAVDQPVVNLVGGVWQGPIGLVAPHDDPLCGLCALRGTVVGMGQWDSGSFSPRAKGDVDGDCVIAIFDVVRAVNCMLGGCVTPPCGEYQLWAADTDCEAGRPCGNGVVEIFDLIRIIRYMMDGVWPCDAAPAARAAISAPVDVSLAVTEDDGEVAVAVKADNATGVAGLDLTVSWKQGSLDFLGAEAGRLVGDGWLVEAQEGHKSVRLIGLDVAGEELTASGGEVVVLRFAAKGGQPSKGIQLDSVVACDGSGNRMATAQ